MIVFIHFILRHLESTWPEIADYRPDEGAAFDDFFKTYVFGIS
jgi:hypothetical protein